MLVIHVIYSFTLQSNILFALCPYEVMCRAGCASVGRYWSGSPGLPDCFQQPLPPSDIKEKLHRFHPKKKKNVWWKQCCHSWTVNVWSGLMGSEGFFFLSFLDMLNRSSAPPLIFSSCLWLNEVLPLSTIHFGLFFFGWVGGGGMSPPFLPPLHPPTHTHLKRHQQA